MKPAMAPGFGLEPQKPWFKPQEVKAGDVVRRMLAGQLKMDLLVIKVTDSLIVTGGGWTFDRVYGAEVDEELGWGPPPRHTGSYLTEVVTNEGKNEPR